MTKQTYITFRGDDEVSLVVLNDENDADVEFVTRAMNNPEITRFLTRRFPVSFSNERQWLKDAYKNSQNSMPLGIVIPREDMLIGVMGLHSINWVNRTAVTGAWIAKNEHRGKGIGTRAKLHLLRYAFYELGLRKITSDVFSTNPRSQRYNEKCGYHVEGILKNQIFQNDTYIDEIIMAVFKEDFDRAWFEFFGKS